MKTDLGYPQYLQFLTYLDCKKRTKKEIEFQENNKNDEVLVRSILGNSSITDRSSERSFHRVSDAIDVMCKQLCPGQWCTRSHCKYYSSHSAYNCSKTRPKLCKEYAKYIAGIEERKNRRYLIYSSLLDDYEGCSGSDYETASNEKLVRCYGDCNGCEGLSHKQTKKPKNHE